MQGNSNQLWCYSAFTADISPGTSWLTSKCWWHAVSFQTVRHNSVATIYFDNRCFPHFFFYQAVRQNNFRHAIPVKWLHFKKFFLSVNTGYLYSNQGWSVKFGAVMSTTLLWRFLICCSEAVVYDSKGWVAVQAYLGKLLKLPLIAMNWHCSWWPGATSRWISFLWDH